MIKVKVDQIDFYEAGNEGYVYGKDLERTRFNYVYVELGREKPYIERPSDDPKTKYRLFRGCNIYYAETLEKMDAGEFIREVIDEIVVIYC